MNCLIYNNVAQLKIFTRVDTIYLCMYFLLSFKLRGFCIKFWPLLLNCIYQLWQCFVVGIFLFKKDSFLTLNELYRHKMERRPIVFNTGIKELKMGALHYSEKFSRSENAFYGDISDPVNRYFDGYICLSRRSIGRRKSIVLNNINNTGIRQ